MSLKDLWLRTPEQISNKTIGQLMAFAGEGKLKDGNTTSLEFRSFLEHVPSAFLERYAEECLSSGFQDSGYALQDIINQIGNRLGFKVQYGRYQGIRGSNGNDGVWQLPDEHSILVEVKTTDTYSIDLNKIADYRRALVNNNEMSVDRSSILLIVGREDTGNLEAQIRGSKHAWEMRLISVSALCHLLRLKEQIEDPSTTKRIYSLLVPREFTKLDAIIDILFSTTEEVQLQDHLEAPTDADETYENSTEPKLTPVAFNDLCIARIQKRLGKVLVKRSRIKFTTPDDTVAVICTVSKTHERYSQPYYWYAFHPHQEQFLTSSSTGYIAFGCGSENNVLLIPFSDFAPWLKGMNITKRDDRFYYHVQISEENGIFNLIRRKNQAKIDLSKYLLE